MAENRFDKAIAYGSPIKANFDGGLIRAVDVVDEAKGKLQSEINSELEKKIENASGNLYKSKGSITAAGLKALTSGKNGDVYNVTEAVTIDGKTYPAGTNVVCVQDFSSPIDPASTSIWDSLAGYIDLSGYVEEKGLNDKFIDDFAFTQDAVGQETGITFTMTASKGLSGISKTKEFALTINPVTASQCGAMTPKLVNTIQILYNKVVELMEKLELSGEEATITDEKGNKIVDESGNLLIV